MGSIDAHFFVSFNVSLENVYERKDVSAERLTNHWEITFSYLIARFFK